MKTLTIIIGTMLTLMQTTTRLKSTDFDGLLGHQWTGILTYLDYGTNKLEPIASELTVTDGKAAGSYSWATVYPQEVSHNSIDEVIISKDGTLVDDELVKERILLPNGTLKFVTIKQGSDNNRKATFKFTYLVGKTTFSRKKEVCYDGTTQWFTRNELSLKTK
ncbi:MAG: hypothetical protein H7289_02710 [Mucilaginibacter sp.]|nr:hypothetical protein [Mucilaginibacter sp.]